MKLQIETTEAVWRRYRKNRDISTRNELLTRYAPLVHRQAARSSRHLSAQVSVDEIASAAFDGLMDAVATFDPDRGFKFETYAAKRILGAIHDWLRSIDVQSRGVRDFQKRQNAAFTVVSSDAGERAPNRQFFELLACGRQGRFDCLDVVLHDGSLDRAGRANNGVPNSKLLELGLCHSHPTRQGRIFGQ